MAIVKEVLSEINRDLAQQIERLGGRAVACSDREEGVLTARKLPSTGPEADIGLVGEVAGVETEVLQQFAAAGQIPVIAPIGEDSSGISYNINGDLAAGAIAAALPAVKLVFLTDVEGIMSRSDDTGQPQILSSLRREEIDRLVAEGTIAGGMIPKVTAGLQALATGVGKVHIIDGRVKHSLLLEIFTDRGIGTEITD